MYTSKRPEDIYGKSFVVTPGKTDQWEPYEDTPQEYLEFLRSPNICRYAVKTTKSGKWLECEVYPIWQTRGQAPKSPPKGTSTAAQKALNERNAKRAFTRIINENFKPLEDVWATFTADDDHLFSTEKDAQKYINNFLERLRRLYKKHGLELKYAYAIEYKTAKDKFKRVIRDAAGTPLVRAHIHIVMNGGVPPADLIKKWGAGRISNVRPLQPGRNGFAGLARYITKEPAEGCRRFNCSRNLKKPRQTVSYKNRKATRTAVRKLAADETLRQEWFEQLYKGKYSFVDCEAIWNEVNDGVYLYCRMELADEEPPSKKRKQAFADNCKAERRKQWA